MDGTIIETKSGRTFYTGRSDWRWFAAGVPQRLRRIESGEYGSPMLKGDSASGEHKAGASSRGLVVVISNQGGILKGKVSEAEVRGRFEDVMKEAGVQRYLVVLCLAEKGARRKPSPIPWQVVEQALPDYSLGIDMANSIYVGDAAGRPAGHDGNPKTKKDFACSDRKFAANVGLNFLTPNQFFLGAAKERFAWGSLDPAAFLRESVGKSPCPTVASIVPVPARQEMVLFVASPASGKSTFFKRHFQPAGYHHASRDALGDEKRCLAAADAALKAGQSVVIDNTSPKADTRAKYIEVARRYHVPVRCFRFITDDLLNQHLNELRGKYCDDHVHVPGIAFNMFKKYFQEPTKAEGFEDVIPVHFVPDFKTDLDRKRFLEWTE